MKKDFPKQIFVAPPKTIKYGMIFPISTKPRNLSLRVKFHASLKFFEPPWKGKYLSARISKISEDDLKMLREIREAILSQKIIARYKVPQKDIFAKFEKGRKIWIGDDPVEPPENQEIHGEITLLFQHVFIGTGSNSHRSISYVLDKFSC